MQVSSINNKYNKPNFNGLSKTLGKHMRVDGKLEIAKQIVSHKPNNTNVGMLPPILFYAIPEKNREQTIKNIIKTFSEVADEIRSFKSYLSNDSQERSNNRPQSSVDKIKKVFIDLGLLEEKDAFDLKFLGEGNYKKAYKLEGVKDHRTGEELAYKVFLTVDRTPEWHKYKTHGNYAELNTSMYWKNTFGPYTQRGKFYFGDIHHGFFVDKFIDDSVEKPKKIVNEEIVGVKLTDEFDGNVGHNRINGYSIDPGGPRVVNIVKNKSKLARKIFQHILKTPKLYRENEWYRILGQKSNLDKKQKEAGLAIAIKHLKNKREAIDICLGFKNQLADVGLAYVLKYLKENTAKKYFKILMQRGSVQTQVVLLNEIPLLARAKKKIDDLDVPKGEINTEKLYDFYRLAKKYVSPEAEQHLASYLHLLPDEYIIPEAKELIAKDKYKIDDRIMHKIKFVKDDEFPYSTKMDIIRLLKDAKMPEHGEESDMLELFTEEELSSYLSKKLEEVRLYTIREQLKD